LALRAPIFLPKSITCLRAYTHARFAQDALAGVTVGVIALPLALAFGIASIPEPVASASGISPPAAGLVTAIVAGFLISALGGSRVAIGGPTGAFIGIVYAIAATHGYDGLLMATLMAGGLLIVMGLARLGAVIKFIPYPVTTGFTSGIAVIIFSGQIRDLLGLDTGPLEPDFIPKVRAYIEHIGSIDLATTCIGVSTAACIVLWRKYVSRRIPGTIVALVLATAIVHAFGLHVETVGGRFGAIPAGLPMPRLPAWDWSRAPELIGPALTIALLGAIESLLCAVVADGMLNTRHRSDTELIAQGVANIASASFAGLPATGAIARTAANVQNGGRTPIAGMIHAITLLVIVLAFARFAALVPLAALAGVLTIVAWNMSEMHRFRWLLNGPRSDALVLVLTFLLTVLTDLTIAVQVGVVLAALLFMKRMADVTSVGAVRGAVRDAAENGGDADFEAIDATQPGGGVEIYEINGPFFFGAAYKLREALAQARQAPRALVLDMERVPAIDATGLHALEELLRRCAADGTQIVIAGASAQCRGAMERSGLLELLGADRLTPALGEGVRLARTLAGDPNWQG
jgi:SulP family sulfate permease